MSDVYKQEATKLLHGMLDKCRHSKPGSCKCDPCVIEDLIRFAEQARIHGLRIAANAVHCQCPDGNDIGDKWAREQFVKDRQAILDLIPDDRSRGEVAK